jgi:methylated-DNA-[protein]-cysteine S-methyltransferase
MTRDTENDTVSLLAELNTVEDEALARLHARLETAAVRADLLDVAYTTLDTPVGALLLAATDRGLVRVAYQREDHDTVLESLAQRLSPRILRAPARLLEASRQVEEYFAGQRTSFDLPLDYALSSGFRQLVQRALPTIPYGSTRSYAQLAQAVGNPKAIRAVGSACATNPLPVVIPCHRVLRSDGSLGGYIGGLAAKTALLSLEAAAA